MLAILNISTHFIWVTAGNHISRWTDNKRIEKMLNYFFSGSLLIVAIWLLLQLELPI
jgi:threonine/homoserine/homoserine lactone efflux protein